MLKKILIICYADIVIPLLAVACFCFTRKKENQVFNVVVLFIGIIYFIAWYLKPFTGILFPYGMYYVSISMGAYISLIIYSVACVLKK